MDLALVEQLIALVARAPIDELDLALTGWRIRIVKAQRTVTAIDAGEAPARAAAVEPDPAKAPASAPDAPHVIKAGLFGVFYRAPAPGQPPFVSVGDAVEEGQTLGILEAMKTFIAVEADRAGTISGILREDGTSVQSGDPLFTFASAG